MTVMASTHTSLETSDADQRLASAVQFLIDGGDEAAATMLLSCDLDYWTSGDTWWVGDEQHEAVHIEMTAPRIAYDALTTHTEVGETIRRAVEAMMPAQTYVKHFEVKAALIDIDPDWRAELLEIARGKGINNQVPRVAGVRSWQALNFRSESEVRIAQALERAGVLFLPNCRARLGAGSTGRKNREPDFLVCDEGRWGVLEVDGEPFHPPSRTTEDHERDRLFRTHGIGVVEHFDATHCYREPDLVVAQFLRLLHHQ